MIAARLATAYYFVHFLIILPLLGMFERPLPLPDSIVDSVLGRRRAAAPAGRRQCRAAVRRLMRAGAAIMIKPHSPRRRRVARPRGPGARRRRDAGAAAAQVELPGPVRHLRPGAAAARLQGLPGGLPACHGLSYVAFRNLAEPGGPEFSEAQVQALAAEYKIKDGPNDAGEMFERAGPPADRFPCAVPERAGGRAANGGKAPPDLSLMAKARTYERGFPWFVIDVLPQYSENGADYIVALLNGYKDAAGGLRRCRQAATTTTTFPATSSRCRSRSATARSSIPRVRDGQPVRCPRRSTQYARDVTAFLDVGGGAASRGAQAHRLPGVILFLICFSRPALLHQEEGLGRRRRRGRGPASA